MSVTIKSSREIELMKEAGNVLAIVHDEIEKFIKPGITTASIDKLAADIIKSYGCIPSFLNYNGYPASICVSLNDMVVHGIPSEKVYLKEGDIVSIDAGVIYQGFHSDAARTWAVGEITPQAKKLIEVAEESFYEGIKFAKEGYRLNDISSAIQDYVEDNGFSVVRDLVGHGIGTELHEEPQVPNFRVGRKGIRLQAGMTLAIEPMINAGVYNVKLLDDGWGFVTVDGSYSAHYENTILITKGEPEILSKKK